jgi:sortase family protein
MAHTDSTRRRAFPVVLAALVALADVVAFGLLRTPASIAGSGHAAHRPVVAAAQVMPAEDVSPIQPVRASQPLAFRLTGAGFTIKAHVCAMANVRPYDPPGEQRHTVCWVREGFGDAPGSHHATSFLFGHSWAEDAQEVLNKASAAATPEILRGHTAQAPSIRPGTGGITAPSPTTTIYPVHALVGYRIVLRTRTGVLTYRVRTVYGVKKDELGYIAEWQNEKIRNRIVLTTCSELNGVDYDYNVVIEAYLVASRPFA